MKRLALMSAALLLTACESERTLSDGKTRPCVGINAVKDSTVVYEYSARNVAVGLIFIELIIPPVKVVFNELECPARLR